MDEQEPEAAWVRLMLLILEHTEFLWNQQAHPAETLSQVVSLAGSQGTGHRAQDSAAEPTQVLDCPFIFTSSLVSSWPLLSWSPSTVLLFEQLECDHPVSGQEQCPGLFHWASLELWPRIVDCWQERSAPRIRTFTRSRGRISAA